MKVKLSEGWQHQGRVSRPTHWLGEACRVGVRDREKQEASRFQGASALPGDGDVG